MTLEAKLEALHALREKVNRINWKLDDMLDFAAQCAEVTTKYIARIPAEDQGRYWPIGDAAFQLAICVGEVRGAILQQDVRYAAMKAIELGRWMENFERCRRRPSADPTEYRSQRDRLAQLVRDEQGTLPHLMLTGPNGIYARVGAQMDPPMSERTVRRMVSRKKVR